MVGSVRIPSVRTLSVIFSSLSLPLNTRPRFCLFFFGGIFRLFFYRRLRAPSGSYFRARRGVKAEPRSQSGHRRWCRRCGNPYRSGRVGRHESFAPDFRFSFRFSCSSRFSSSSSVASLRLAHSCTHAVCCDSAQIAYTIYAGGPVA